MKGELEDLGEEYENVGSISKIQTQILNRTGGAVNIFDDKGNFKSTYEILKGISQVWDHISQTDQADLLEIVAGKQRGNQVAALIQSFQSGQVDKALQASINSAGSAQEEQTRWLESLDAKTQQYEASFQSLSQTVLNSNFLKTLVDSGTELNNVLNAIIQTFGLFPTAISAIGIGAFVKNFQDLKTAGTAATALKELNSAVSTGISNYSSLATILKTVDTQTKINIISQSALSKEQKVMALTTAGVSTEEIKAAISTGTLTTAQTTAKVSTLGLSTALKGLWATMLANPLMLAGMAITAGFSAWNAYKQSVEETRQATQEAAGTFGETTKSIDEYAEKYKKLRDELVNTNTTEERQHEIKTDLLSLQQELNDKYGEEYGKLNLVTNAYKDQTQAILDMNKAAAKNYLLENREGIDSATRKMEQQRTYSLGSTGYMSNEYAQQLYDVVSRYADQGINLEQFNAGSQTGYTIKFTGDAEQANKVIHDVANQVQDLEDRFKDNNFVQSFLDNSANALKENNKVLDKYQEQYDKALMAQIASDDKLSEGYTNAKSAVKEYNDAVASGDESKISSARKNLNDVKDSIDLTSSDWKRYGSIVSQVFSNADTGLYDFEDQLKGNQDNLLTFANTLRGLSEEDLLSMANDGRSDNFDKLIESAKKYGLSAENVIAVLQRLNIIQREIAKSGTDAFAPITKEELITNINSLSSGFESLDKIMNSMQGKNPFDYSLLDDKNFKANFSELGDSYTRFIEKISSSPKDVKGTQSAFNDLVTTWIDSSGVLSNLTDENASLAAAMLKNMGVANADEIVSTNLAATQEHLAAQKAYTADMSDALTNATASEITGLINEATQSDIARVAIAGLALEKANANGTALDTSGDIENVISLIGVIGTASTALNNYNKLKAGQIFDANTQKANRDKIFSGGFNAGQLGQSTEEARQLSDYNKQVEQAKSAAQKEVDDAIKAAKGYKGKGTQANVDYSGGVKTNKPSSGSKEKTKKEFSEIFDWVQITIDRVNEKIEQLKDKISNTSGWKAKNAITGTALDEMSTKVSALESQLNTYQGKLDEAESKLNATYIDKIKNGTLEVETVTDEVISKNIKEYQDWYGKINDVNKELDNTKKAMQELAKSRLDNIINDFESLTSLMNKYSSYRKNLLDLQKSLGQEISNTDYEQLINQQESIYNQLQSEYSSLQSELSKAVSAGTIKVGSEEWRKYNGELIDINSSMNDAVSSMNDFRKALMDLPFEQLQMVSNEFDRINNGIGTMIDVMGSSGTTENGMITAKGLAQIALYGKQYANAKQQAAEYSNAISALNDMYDNGSITQEEYNSKLSEYTNAQLSAVKATKEAEDAILQFRKTAIQEQIDDYNKLIEAKKKARDEDKSYEEYLAQIEEKQKNISTLQAKIDELSTKSDASDRSAIATRLQLENDLVNARKDLAKTQSDYAYDQTTKSLDKQAEEYQNAKDKELNDLETSTDAQQKVIEDYLGQVKDNYKTVYNTLSKYGSDYNIEMTGDLVSPWESANTAVDTFQSAVSDAIAQINIDIGNLDLSKLTEMVQTMNGFSGGGNGSTFEDISGTGSWQKNSTGWWYGASNEDYASGGIYTIGGKQYNFNEDGYMKTGWDDSSGEWRYFEPSNGQMVKSTWRKGSDGKDYYLTSSGTMATDMAIKAKSGEGYYYVDDNGAWDGKTLSYNDVKKQNIQIGYKNGTRNSVSGLKYVEEDQPELIYTKDGTLLKSAGGDMIFNGGMLDNLWNLASDPSKYIGDKLLRNQMDLNSIKATSRNVEPIIQLNAPLMTINNTDENTMNLLNNRLNIFATKELPIAIQQNMQRY